MLSLALPVVLPALSSSGHMLDHHLAQIVSIIVMHALMVPLVILARLALLKLQEIFVNNALQ